MVSVLVLLLVLRLVWLLFSFGGVVAVVFSMSWLLSVSSLRGGVGVVGVVCVGGVVWVCVVVCWCVW